MRGRLTGVVAVLLGVYVITKEKLPPGVTVRGSVPVIVALNEVGPEMVGSCVMVILPLPV